MSVVLLVCLFLRELGDFPGSVGTKSGDLQRAVAPEWNLNKSPATHQGAAPDSDVDAFALRVQRLQMQGTLIPHHYQVTSVRKGSSF
jgi:hypothetical protein